MTGEGKKSERRKKMDRNRNKDIGEASETKQRRMIGIGKRNERKRKMIRNEEDMKRGRTKARKRRNARVRLFYLFLSVQVSR